MQNVKLGYPDFTFCILHYRYEMELYTNFVFPGVATA
jgi:hypothetical protein